jgi:hypothetical protein
VANAFNSFSVTFAEKLNSQQIKKGDATSLQKDSFHRNFLSMKIIPITETKIKVIVHSLKQKEIIRL